MVAPCLYLEYLQAAARCVPFSQPREQINHFAITLSRSLSTCALFAPRRRLDACYYCVDSSRRPARSVGRSESYGERREGRSNVKRYGQRHAHGIQYPRLQCCCILIDLPSSVHVPLSRRHKVGLVANILPGPGQQNNNNAISKWQKSPTIIWRPRMAARRTPACLDLARRKLRFRGVCTAASRKSGRLDATVEGEMVRIWRPL